MMLCLPSAVPRAWRRLRCKHKNCGVAHGAGGARGTREVLLDRQEHPRDSAPSTFWRAVIVLLVVILCAHLPLAPLLTSCVCGSCQALLTSWVCRSCQALASGGLDHQHLRWRRARYGPSDNSWCHTMPGSHQFSRRHQLANALPDAHIICTPLSAAYYTCTTSFPEVCMCFDMLTDHECTCSHCQWPIGPVMTRPEPGATSDPPGHAPRHTRAASSLRSLATLAACRRAT
jgi:hypothetical protein